MGPVVEQGYRNTYLPNLSSAMHIDNNILSYLPHTARLIEREREGEAQHTLFFSLLFDSSRAYHSLITTE